jgi:hypothetical protein
MFIPLDHLYHWISGVTPKPAIIYYLYPHGSKNLNNVVTYPIIDNLEVGRSLRDRVNVFCFDQEPLNFDFYQQIDSADVCLAKGFVPNSKDWLGINHSLKNINAAVDYVNSSIYDSTVLIHSEKNSDDVEKYRLNGYIPVHYWCHAIIARDWYRFAALDNRLEQKNICHDYLIYARDWSGSREYRLKFIELLVNANLHVVSKCYFNSVSHNVGYNYTDHIFANRDFCIETKNLESYCYISKVTSNASAEYDIVDHQSTHISVVLETQFDANKIHLTEKICRSLACGHPFILAAGPFSLEYLKNYGFETFHPWIDESYDKEKNSVKRLEKIIESMKKFSMLPIQEKSLVTSKINEIARKNRQKFFSSNFSQNITQELVHNLKVAFNQACKTKAQKWCTKRKLAKSVFSIFEFNHTLRYPELHQQLTLVRQLRKNYNLTIAPDHDAGKS